MKYIVLLMFLFLTGCSMNNIENNSVDINIINESNNTNFTFNSVMLINNTNFLTLDCTSPNKTILPVKIVDYNHGNYVEINLSFAELCARAYWNIGNRDDYDKGFMIGQSFGKETCGCNNIGNICTNYYDKWTTNDNDSFIVLNGVNRYMTQWEINTNYPNYQIVKEEVCNKMRCCNE